ncbi:hypothetical protein CYJ34_00865 [Anaerococcus octavius]|uniref:Uncharacterized protein n=2 Tax=Peptoniphilaceae TaxID=1570339 RepID=A0A2I1MAY0_9FIRM|nr:hypothetical protein CYJ34_00865 [Anaerococcus octavius]
MKMKRESKLEKLKTISDIVYMSNLYLLIYLFVYQIFIFYKKEQLYFFIPIFVYIFSTAINKIFKTIELGKLRVISTIISFLILCGVVNLTCLNRIYMNNQLTILTILSLAFFIMLLISKYYLNDSLIFKKNSVNTKSGLFNIFYLNDSKAYEISMLINNKIARNIDKETTSEEIFRTISSLSPNTSILSAENSVQKEDNFRERIYKKYDIKITKSIILRELYNIAKKNTNNTENIQPGQLILFEDVKLKRTNVNSTVMILNILKDSKLKNQIDENIEIDLNKTMERMLDDFTIDYKFEYRIGFNEKIYDCVIQLPYNTDDNFENGYNHNDLQLGKLSIIGIYRGEINFSDTESVSSKFLEIVNDQYKKNNNIDTENIIKDSNTSMSLKENTFNLEDDRIEGKKHLIDVVAIIQELKIKMEIENE